MLSSALASSRVRADVIKHLTGYRSSRQPELKLGEIPMSTGYGIPLPPSPPHGVRGWERQGLRHAPLRVY